MRWFRWLLRSHKRTAPIGTCAYCALDLVVCPSCSGNWRGRECACGIGATCAVHHAHWG